ncbi:MAG: hypothetical protein LBG74_00595, partial [Spirochaetaceae bacterium]|nr:hypothetical protein [Spirochaetaceae bacterium]
NLANYDPNGPSPNYVVENVELPETGDITLEATAVAAEGCVVELTATKSGLPNGDGQHTAHLTSVEAPSGKDLTKSTMIMAEVYKAGDVSQKRVYTFDLKGKTLELESLTVSGVKYDEAGMPTSDALVFEPSWEAGKYDNYAIAAVGRGSTVTFTAKKKSAYDLLVYRQSALVTGTPDPGDPDTLTYTITGANSQESQVVVDFKVVSPLMEYVTYPVTLFVPQGQGDDNPYLLNLTASYTQGGGSIFGFSRGDIEFTVLPSSDDQRKLYFTAQAESKHSGVTVEAAYSDSDGSITINSLVTNSATKSISGYVDIPSRIQKSRTLTITVTQGNRQANRQYRIYVNPCPTTPVVWKGKAVYTGSGKKITSVTGRGYNSAGETTLTTDRNDITPVPVGSGYTVDWVIHAGDDWLPQSFLLTLVDEVDTNKLYESAAILPATADITAAKPTAASNWETPATNLLVLTIEADDVGNRIYDARDLYEKLGGTALDGTPLLVDTTANYSLAGDIDLTTFTDSSGNPIAWTGPAGYSGHLFGNGYTISGLVLTPTSISVGLFSTLGNGAKIENFTLEVSTPNNATVEFTTSNPCYIGGLLGRADSGTLNITIENVHVKGVLKVSKVAGTGGGIYFGGLIGEARNFRTINISRCSSEVDVKMDWSGIVGGFIGRQYQNQSGASLNFIDCYASGKVTVESDLWVNTGAFMGDIYGSGAAIAITFDRCYASGDVEVINSDGAVISSTQYAGGFVGGIGTNAGGITGLTVELKNSVAAGSKVVSPAMSGENQGRLAGFVSSNANVNVTFSDNIANALMLVGDGTLTHSDDEADRAGTTKWGKGVPNTAALGGLKNATTWTALGWSGDTWDFTPLSQGKWPALR